MIRAELSKLVTLPATWTTLGATLAANVLLTFVIAVGDAPVAYSRAGFIVLGVLATCSEYTGGQIRTTLTVMPRRVRQLAAKHAALAVVTLPAALVVALSGPLIILAVLGTPVGVWQVAEVTAYLTLLTLLSAAVGVLLRHTLAGVALLLGCLFVAAPFVHEYLPDDMVTLVVSTPVLLIVAALAYRRRDA
ncbi:ABC transporter permease [Herbidospora cretacea]|uniref:ABC transporter permease n=1 Tax=Herbidospora cretacea TaxID=28444 RepID=UPI0004C47946|nr:ABC transporter permease [Herbidospora cretacea]